MKTVADVILSYGEAARGCYPDGRKVERDMGEIALVLCRHGDRLTDEEDARLRADVGLCPSGKGHWAQLCGELGCTGGDA